MKVKVKKGQERCIAIGRKCAVHIWNKVVSTFDHGIVAFKTANGNLVTYKTGDNAEIGIVVSEHDGIITVNKEMYDNSCENWKQLFCYFFDEDKEFLMYGTSDYMKNIGMRMLFAFEHEIFDLRKEAFLVATFLDEHLLEILSKVELNGSTDNEASLLLE